MYFVPSSLCTISSPAECVLVATDPGSSGHFVLGVCSEEEMSTIKSVLTPTEDRVIKGHITDIVESTTAKGSLVMKMRDLHGNSFDHVTAHGTFVVNCTDHISSGLLHEPILSSAGKVLAPQTACFFTGPTANHLTHLWFLDKLEPLWRKLPRLVLDPGNKASLGILGLFPLLLSTVRCLSALPQDLRKNNEQNFLSWFPYYRQLLSGRALAGKRDALFEATRRWLPHRYTDNPDRGLDYAKAGVALLPGASLAKL
eukprot:SAG31_NODE_322_length_17726_cov_18.070006_14_plen_256_part_00